MLSVGLEVSQGVDVNAGVDKSEDPVGASQAMTNKDAMNEPIHPVRNQAEKIEQWLRQYGFTYNPFQFTASERDANLTEHFVEYPDFAAMLELKDHIFFARTGDGKTALRLRLQAFYQDAVRDRRVFAFSYLIPQEIAATTPPSIDDHLERVLTAAVRHAFIFFALRGIDLPALQDKATAQPLAQQFAVFFDHYYGLQNAWQSDLRQALVDYSLRQAVRSLAPVYDNLEAPDAVGGVNTLWLQHWLQLLETPAQQTTFRLAAAPRQRWQQFNQLIQATGIQTVLILVDGVDVKPGQPAILVDKDERQPKQRLEKQDSVTRMAAIVRSVLEIIQDSMPDQHLVWKLFLPIELYTPLIPYLPKQISHAILYWDHARLGELLRFRLSAATHGAFTTLLQLAEDDVPADFETFLIVQSESSPRYLLHYINQIFGLHVDKAGAATTPGKLSGSLLSQIRYTPHRVT